MLTGIGFFWTFFQEWLTKYCGIPEYEVAVMLKSVAVLFTALFAGLILAGSATTASAHYRYSHYRHSGCCGGHIPPTYVYHTAHEVTHLTRYRDVSRTRYVYRTHRIVHVTRVQPVVYIHSVTRVHHHTVGIVRPVYQNVTEYLPPRRILTNSVTNSYECRCRRRCH